MFALIITIVGKLLKSRRNFQFDRISAMDPAGPLFFNDVPYPWDYLNVTSASRLTRTDARLVDVIHTDGDARYLGYIPQVSITTVLAYKTHKENANTFSMERTE